MPPVPGKGQRKEHLTRGLEEGMVEYRHLKSSSMSRGEKGGWNWLGDVQFTEKIEALKSQKGSQSVGKNSNRQPLEK